MTIGPRVYGLGALVLGIPGLVYANFAAMGLAVPPSTPGYTALVYLAGAVLVLAGLAIYLPRLAAPGSLALAAFFAASLLALQLPLLATQPMTWVTYEIIAETLVMMLGGLLAWRLLRGAGNARTAALLRIGRPLFGTCLVVFGTSEFVYSAFTSSLVPAWLPPSQLAWTYLTALAQIAAGLAIASGIKARLAAILLTAMYLVFALIVHLPRVIADPTAPGAWSENGVNLVLTGAAWILAETLAQARR